MDRRIKNKINITRKEFIAKTSKCAGGVICAPLLLSVFQSCGKPDPLGFSDDSTQYISECPCHGAQFDQEGNVLQYPTTGDQIDPLLQYSISNLDENSFKVIDSEGSEIEIFLSDHPLINNINGVSSTDSNGLDNHGFLLYRKSVDEIIVLSRNCPHQGCQVQSFEEL